MIMMEHSKPQAITPEIFQFDFTDRGYMSPGPSQHGLTPDIEITSTLVEEVEPTPLSGNGLRLFTPRLILINIH
jgi:hypothetical protein